ncbi:bifunctional diaminohydroxyphosphoribosylaminopyrimidine deaminase/5-amino-6-(5-phosphoribosylamino)uracil reductase RibD [Allomuricauda sp. SCSIO 65647]|uniref:bifunctional diaminohydroxyphosphoribosylaminopyrimidine deaminase/5-amino-6-(5-phosphoribosylamino)uracil reductase RibD n=1 Tax=Allomuricauda sp. SCSIO 65647 TaxID=2908843 RepID=UPI001F022624|nr:bifunctional diaminohydroxyphosphoribosylaminopyrimidine deaminase/5-amino-6-(5-phosphoribosylamino)uracil reductase RibD [Muricauda sp. SCSIO 65647]UJH67614.1 bifunctional diaminohydroxyphosphoribosylaminopyrimidine deaminase/5-amino-6-(5-phosphoribosylamino)uracil reductase RibD [Muricauda sp. SCSIO 65647]
MKIAEKYMHRCIKLGKNALGLAAPNPMVGCVIAHDGKIIGEGFTSEHGGPHAEVNAIRSVKKKELLREATLFVTLEPCSHFGKTPPCADLIIEHHIKNVVIGVQDPHDKVAGLGIKKLKAAGCQVTVGVLEEECREHHKRFLTFHEKKRPYIILKWAETWDGFIAPKQEKRTGKPQPYWITNEHSRQLVHKWRSEEQAILVGTKTALEDNPKLNVRDWEGKNPIRVLLDKERKIDNTYHVMDKSVKTIVFTEEQNAVDNIDGIIFEPLDFQRNVAQQLCSSLHHHNISSIIVEGGAKTLQTFIDENMWDEARVFKGKTIFKEGIKAPALSGIPITTNTILNDTLTILTP